MAEVGFRTRCGDMCSFYDHQVLIEKLLRVQPNLKKLYILVREKNGLSARERLKREVCIDG
ncbi:Fatty acyl-CoA reductase 1-like protein, partial [Drosera capensis]